MKKLIVLQHKVATKYIYIYTTIDERERERDLIWNSNKNPDQIYYNKNKILQLF